MDRHPKAPRGPAHATRVLSMLLSLCWASTPLAAIKSESGAVPRTRTSKLAAESRVMPTAKRKSETSRVTESPKHRKSAALTPTSRHQAHASTMKVSARQKGAARDAHAIARRTGGRADEVRTTPAAKTPRKRSQMGVASFYGAEFANRPTASGEPFNPRDLTAAHRTLPLGTRVRVTNLENGKQTVVRINDRGPYRNDRVIDLSRAAARKLGFVQDGIAHVRIEVLKPKRGDSMGYPRAQSARLAHDEPGRRKSDGALADANESRDARRDKPARRDRKRDRDRT